MNAAVQHARCDACSALCCRLTVVLQPEDDHIPEHLTARLESGLRVMAHGEHGWCVAIDTQHMNCGIYEERPTVCRRFVMDGPYCRAIQQPELPQRVPVDSD
jgi:uncharacterized protein